MNNQVGKFKSIDQISADSGLPKKLLISSARKLDIDPSVGITNEGVEILVEITKKIINNNIYLKHSSSLKHSTY